ncbi:hypothetical protein MTO96_017428 [Rhipicephalus appendiculatus]
MSVVSQSLNLYDGIYSNAPGAPLLAEQADLKSCCEGAFFCIRGNTERLSFRAVRRADATTAEAATLQPSSYTVYAPLLKAQREGHRHPEPRHSRRPTRRIFCSASSGVYGLQLLSCGGEFRVILQKPRLLLVEIASSPLVTACDFH